VHPHSYFSRAFCCHWPTCKTNCSSTQKGTRIEPTDHSFEAIETFERGRNYDGFADVGGSSFDSAKAANLFATFPLNAVTLPPMANAYFLESR
jgi:hypothetical protein